MLTASDHFIHELPAISYHVGLRKFFDMHSHLYVNNENINNPMHLLYGVQFHNILLLADFSSMNYQAAVNVSIDDEPAMESSTDSMYFTNSMLVLFGAIKLFDWGNYPKKNISRIIFEYNSSDDITMFLGFRYSGLIRVGQVTVETDLHEHN